MQKIEYSCKRKKDFVTFCAVAFFLGICCFEIYLIVILPIQLKRHDAMVYQVKKQEVTHDAEEIKWHVREAKPKNLLQTSEVQLVSGCMDQISAYLRKNLKHVSYPQIMEVYALLERLKKNSNSWDDPMKPEKKAVYLFRENEFDMTPFMRNMESKLDAAEQKEQ